MFTEDISNISFEADSTKVEIMFIDHFQSKDDEEKTKMVEKYCNWFILESKEGKDKPETLLFRTKCKNNQIECKRCNDEDCTFCSEKMIRFNDLFITSITTKQPFFLRNEISCTEKHCIFVVECKICNKQAVGFSVEEFNKQYDPNTMLLNHLNNEHNLLEAAGLSELVSIHLIDKYENTDDESILYELFKKHVDFFKPEIGLSDISGSNIQSEIYDHDDSLIGFSDFCEFKDPILFGHNEKICERFFLGFKPGNCSHSYRASNPAYP